MATLATRVDALEKRQSPELQGKVIFVDFVSPSGKWDDDAWVQRYHCDGQFFERMSGESLHALQERVTMAMDGVGSMSIPVAIPSGH